VEAVAEVHHAREMGFGQGVRVHAGVQANPGAGTSQAEDC
jgi:hypothetical protein